MLGRRNGRRDKPRQKVRPNQVTAESMGPHRPRPGTVLAAPSPSCRAKRWHQGVRVAEPPPAASEAQPHKTTKARRLRTPRAHLAYRLRGRYWDRTSDLFRVREARYRCANRPRKTSKNREGSSRWRRDSNPCTRLCRPLPRLSATPPSTLSLVCQNHLRADDRVRTGDLNLGKVTLYQLSYVRTTTGLVFDLPA